MSSPLVSVIIPVYNAEKYIEQTIQSVLQQTFQDFEIIVLNDGSKDHSGEIIQRMQQADNRIQYIPKANTGVSDTRNIGISKAKGKYLAFLDADDIWLPENLAEKVSVLEQTGKLWTFSDYEYLYENDNHLRFEKKEIKPYNITDNLLLWEMDVVPGPCSNIVVIRTVFDSGVKFDTKLSSPADRDICLQISTKGDAVFINKVLWRYRLHVQSMTNQNSRAIDEMKYLYKKADKEKWFSNPALRRKALSNANLIMAGMSYFFPSERRRIPGFLIKSFWYSPGNFFKKKVLPLIRRKK